MTTRERQAAGQGQTPPGDKSQSGNNTYLIGVARAFGGAIIFALPMLMTMEMWHLGFYIDRLQLAVLLITAIPLLVGLSHFLGFEETFGWKDDLLDAFVAYAVGFTAAGLVLVLLSVIEIGMHISEVIGKISIQVVPASIGALLAQSQLGVKASQEDKKRQAGYLGELFFMLVGALFLSLNLAPTEEMVLIAYKMTFWHTLVLGLVSLLVIHAFVYSLKFQGHSTIPPDTPAWSIFLRYSVVGYAIALLVSLFALWVFGRQEGTSFVQLLTMTVVLGFPAAVGAAAARLIL